METKIGTLQLVVQVMIDDELCFVLVNESP